MPAAAASSDKNKARQARLTPKLSQADFEGGTGGLTRYDLVNQDPDVSYYWTTPGDHKDYMLSCGWSVILASADPSDVRPRAGDVVPGQAIQRSEMILLGIHKADHALIVKYGAEGGAGQQLADAIDARLATGLVPDSGDSPHPHILLGGDPAESSAQTRDNG